MRSNASEELILNAVTCLGAFYRFLAQPALSHCVVDNSPDDMDAPAMPVHRLFVCTHKNVLSPCLLALQGRLENSSQHSKSDVDLTPVSKVAILRCGHVISVLLSAIDATSRSQMLPKLKIEALDTLTYLAYCLCIGGHETGETSFFLWQFIPGISSRLVRVLANILKRNTATGGTSRVMTAVVSTLSTMLQVGSRFKIHRLVGCF